MKIKDLINELKKYGVEEEIAFASDEEGNVINMNAVVCATDVGKDKNLLVIYPSGSDILQMEIDDDAFEDLDNETFTLEPVKEAKKDGE